MSAPTKPGQMVRDRCSGMLGITTSRDIYVGGLIGVMFKGGFGPVDVPAMELSVVDDGGVES